MAGDGSRRCGMFVTWKLFASPLRPTAYFFRPNTGLAEGNLPGVAAGLLDQCRDNQSREPELARRWLDFQGSGKDVAVAMAVLQAGLLELTCDA